MRESSSHLVLRQAVPSHGGSRCRAPAFVVAMVQFSK